MSIFQSRLFTSLLTFTCCLVGPIIGPNLAIAQDSPLVYVGTEGPGVGRHIVFLAGDHEYRGEQTTPMLARILAKHHGFKCTVLFSVDKKTGEIVPGSSNIPGTEALNDADLAVFFLRFQNLPDEQMKPIVDYLERAGPVVGLRTSTHAFKIPKKSTYSKYDFKFDGKDYKGGFGRQVLGETWVGHYGRNHVMSTRLDIVPSEKDHPILAGVSEPWTQSGGYWTDPMPDSTVLALTQPLATMKKGAEPADDKKPCPNCWTRNYKGKDGATGRVFNTTSGASEDILDDGFRRMLVNSCYWAMGMENEIKPDSNIDFVGEYNPSTFRMNSNYYVGVKPSDLSDWDSPIMSVYLPLKQAKPKKKKANKKSATKKQAKQDQKTKAGSKKQEDVAAETETFQPAKNPAPQPPTGAALDVELGDHICIIGNGLGESLQHHNYFETLLHSAKSDKELTVRNLCFPGDTIDLRLRSLNFGDPNKHLAHSKADAVLMFFGSNESFAGEQGRESFAASLEQSIKEIKGTDYSGNENGTKVVLVSPIAFEKTGDVNLPDGVKENERLKSYTETMKRVAAKNGVGFVDLFTPTEKLFADSAERLTLNGFQPNDVGYKALAPILLKGLLGADTPVKPNADLKAQVDDKNFHWWHRYRAVNGFSIYGTRGKAGSDGTYNNEDVMERERDILDQMTANRDLVIWNLAQGKPAPATIDDSNTLPFINPKTNVGGPDDKQAKAGKLGSLEYSPAEVQANKFDMADGYEINVFASEEQFPELANPVSMTFDSRGRLWVSTMPSYPHWKPKTKLADKLLILTDTDNDGKADECKVFADGLYLPTGFELGNGGAYVAQQPDILFLKDTDGDDVADVRTRIITGFGTADSHHGIAAFEWGPGGGLYFNEGTFKYSQVESPYGLTRCNEAGIWRHHPKTLETNLHVNYAFANPWGHVFDDWGQNFIADASGGQNYWATLISGKTIYPEKHPGGGHYRRALGIPKGKEIPDAPKLLKKRTRPSSGCEIVSSSHFPDDAQGNFLVNNVIGDLAVLNHKMANQDSGFFGTEVPPILEGKDGNFRPVDIQFGPDGALYLVDWHNALIGHLQHNLREPNRDKSHGRIWRITYKGRPLVTPPKIFGASVSELVEALKTPEYRNRYRVRRELAQRPTEEVIKAVEAWMAKLDPDSEDYERMMLEALWQYQTQNVLNEELLTKMLNAKDFRARAAAVRVLSFWYPRLDNSIALLEPRLKDESARVRAEAIRTASFLDPEEVTPLVLDAIDAGMDQYLDYLMDETMKVLED